MNKKICVVYTHHKLGDLIWQLPYIKAISEHHSQNVDLILRESTQAKQILQDLKHIKIINYNNFRKGIFYWVDVIKLIISVNDSILIAFSSFFGNIIANSYLPFAIDANMLTIAINNDNVPKSEGV